MANRILITEPIIEEPVEALREQYDVTVGERGYYDKVAHLKQDISRFDAVLSLLSNPITEEVIEAAESLKIIANLAAGYDNIDVEAAREASIAVANTPGVLTEATADATFALLLSAARRLPEAEQYLREGHFDGWDPLGFLGKELNGSSLGIFGMGKIGTAVARRARGFGMDILYHNRNRVNPSVESEVDATYVESVHELAEKSDILCLNCPLNDGTRHAVDQPVLEALGPEGILVNTARGAVVDEKALAEALHTNVIGAAALDVFEDEPAITDALFDAPNCIMTPHIGSGTNTTRLKMGMLAVNSIKAALNNEEIPNVVSG